MKEPLLHFYKLWEKRKESFLDYDCTSHPWDILSLSYTNKYYNNYFFRAVIGTRDALLRLLAGSWLILKYSNWWMQQSFVLNIQFIYSLLCVNEKVFLSCKKADLV